MSQAAESGTGADRFRVAHLTTVDLSLRFLVRPQLLAVIEVDGEAVGISAPGPWVAELEQQGIRHVALDDSTRGMSLGRDLRAAWQLWGVLRAENLTVLHTHNPKPGIYGRVLGRLAGVPLVVNTLHGLYATETDGLAKRSIVYALEAVAARFSDIELHQNPEDLEFCRRTGILPRGRGQLLGNGVDLSRFDPSRLGPAARPRIRSELDVADDQVLVGVVGRLVAEKGYPELFEAFRELEESYVLVVIGPEDPDKADSVPAEMVAAARNAGVRFLGMRTDVEDLYAAMDVFVLPSHREGFPRAAMEAAAMGLPVVATDIRGCRQVVDDGINGFLVPVRSPHELARALARIGADSSLRAEMGAASRRIALERFDEEKVVEIVMDAYRNGLRHKGMGHLLPAGRSGGERAPAIREAVRRDARSLANMHHDAISSGFLRRLGRPFLRVLYGALIDWKDGTVLVAEDSDGQVGFVAGVTNVSLFYRDFALRHGWRAIVAALPKLIRPSTLRRAWETFRYGQESDEVEAELLSMAVAPRVRGKGLSQSLGALFLDRLGVGAVRVVVGDGNEVAIGAYRKMGFVDAGDLEVHSQERSKVLVWHR